MSNELAREVYAPSNIVAKDSIETGPYPRDMLWIWFRNDTPQAQRQAAIHAVGGLVVGGYRYRAGGVYYVRIKQDGTTGPLHAAIARLKALPQVTMVTPDLSLAGASSQGH
jgi:hypothetical protein